MSLSRIARSGLIALGLGLLMPLTTLAAASSYQATTVTQLCTRRGGSNHRGYVELKVKGREVGRSGTNYIVFKSKIQGNTGAGWGTQTNLPDDRSMVFPNDSSNYYHVTDRRYDLPRGFEVAVRMSMTVQFWSSSAGLLATRTVNGNAC